MSDLSTSGPLPSKHVFLYELAKLPGGSKVRFLGCVVNYEVSTGFLLLEYGFQQKILPTPQASVDVRLVLESIKAQDLQRGSWLNIIGYLQKPEQRQKKTTSSNTNTNNIQRPEIPIVQAIIVWGAGAIKVANYETALVSQREMKQAGDVQAPP